MGKETILVIEDETDIIELLEYNLEKEGFKVLSARDGESGVRDAIQKMPSLILLDLMLPGMGGTEVCRSLKQKTETALIPIIMVTAKGEESDIMVGLEIGADDYVTKPFSPKELIARIRAVLRRGGKKSQKIELRIENGPIAVDSMRHEVWVRKQPVILTLAEFRLLHLLLEHAGRVFTRDQLLQEITGGESVIIDRNVDVHIRSIRKKLGKDGSLILTIRGIGYKFQD